MAFIPAIRWERLLEGRVANALLRCGPYYIPMALLCNRFTPAREQRTLNSLRTNLKGSAVLDIFSKFQVPEGVAIAIFILYSLFIVNGLSFRVKFYDLFGVSIMNFFDWKYILFLGTINEVVFSLTFLELLIIGLSVFADDPAIFLVTFPTMIIMVPWLLRSAALGLANRIKSGDRNITYFSLRLSDGREMQEDAALLGATSNFYVLFLREKNSTLIIAKESVRELRAPTPLAKGSRLRKLLRRIVE